jgi:hypothetical protein
MVEACACRVAPRRSPAHTESESVTDSGRPAASGSGHGPPRRPKAPAGFFFFEHAVDSGACRTAGVSDGSQPRPDLDSCFSASFRWRSSGCGGHGGSSFQRDYSEVALKRGEPPPNAERYAPYTAAINLVAGGVAVSVILLVVISGIPYETWTAIAGSTIWLKFFRRLHRQPAGAADLGQEKVARRVVLAGVLQSRSMAWASPGAQGQAPSDFSPGFALSRRCQPALPGRTDSPRVPWRGCQR